MAPKNMYMWLMWYSTNNCTTNIDINSIINNLICFTILTTTILDY